MKKLLAAVAAVACLSAQAQLIDVAGESYSIEQATGLKWLDISATAGLSYNEASAGLDPKVWRLASWEELERLVGSYSASNGDQLFSTLGAAPTIEATWGGGGGCEPSAACHSSFWISELNDAPFLSRAGSVADTAKYAHMFVAGVPEPSTYVMMAIGVAGLGWAARRQRRKL